MNQENQNIEHKRIWKDEYLKWVSGFANAQGGKIYIGIDDDLTMFGVDNLHKQLEDIPNKIINNTGVLGLIKDGIPTNGAVLLFGEYPQRRLVTSSFKIGRFGADDADLLSQD